MSCRQWSGVDFVVGREPDHQCLSRQTLPNPETEMRRIAQRVVSFLKKEDGPTAVEYAVMLALIIVVCIAAISALGKNANNTFSRVGSGLGG
jgi:pilus assembly protein Flp/PilA